MQTAARRLVFILLLGTAIVPLPVAYAVHSVDAGDVLPLEFTPTPHAHLPSFADQPTVTPTPAATSTPTPTSTPSPTATFVPTPASTSTTLPYGQDGACTERSECVPTPPALLDDAAVEQWVASQLNGQRFARGLPPLNWVPELAQAARRHSRDMADHGFTAHTGSDGSDSGQRMAEAGYVWTTGGEIIGWGYGGDIVKMVTWWMACPVHRPMILSSRFTDLGVGYVSDPASEWGHYWTVNFGRRAHPASGG